mgnify:FL=1
MADIFAILETLGIKKKILYAGKGTETEYEDGTKVCSPKQYYSEKPTM